MSTATRTGGRETEPGLLSARSRTEAQKYVFVLPAFALFAVFVLFPLAASLYFGFTRWDGLGTPEWVGFKNYLRAVTSEIYLWSYVHNVLYILGTLVVEVVFGLIMAVLLNSERRGFSLFRVLFFSPVVLSMVAAGLLWTYVYDLRYGLLNTFLTQVGLESLIQPWLSNPDTALAAVTVVSGWKYAGVYMIIYLAALQRIPSSYYEAAIIDGAGPLRIFFRITLPLLRETTVVALLLAFTGGFAAFDLFFTMTNGQPFNATEIPTTWIIKQAFDRNNMGYGVALTVIMAIVVGLVSIVYLRYARRSHVVQY